jgi:hypothetical protein
MFAIGIGRFIGLAVTESIFIAQLVIWWSAITYTYVGLGKLLNITQSANPYQQAGAKSGRDIVIIGLGLNIFVSPYLSVGLTDSVYTALTLMFAVWITLYASTTGRRSVFTGLLLASLALVIRPAAIWLFIPLLVVIIVFAIRRAKFWNLTRASLVRAGRALFVALAGTLPILSQSFIQYFKFGVFSPLPASDLGGNQVIWGIKYIKYASWVGDGPRPNYYPSEELIGPQNPEGISWYWENLFHAFQLLTFKLIGAFDFDYLVPYPTEQPENSWLFGSTSLLILIFGLASAFTHLFSPLKFLGPKWLPILMFLSWSAIHLASALELRFSLPMILYLSIISVPLIERVWNSKPVMKLVFGATLSVAFTTAWFIAAEVRSYSVLN